MRTLTLFFLAGFASCEESEPAPEDQPGLTQDEFYPAIHEILCELDEVCGVDTTGPGRPCSGATPDGRCPVEDEDYTYDPIAAEECLNAERECYENEQGEVIVRLVEPGVCARACLYDDKGGPE